MDIYRAILSLFIVLGDLLNSVIRLCCYRLKINCIVLLFVRMDRAILGNLLSFLFIYESAVLEQKIGFLLFFALIVRRCSLAFGFLMDYEKLLLGFIKDLVLKYNFPFIYIVFFFFWLYIFFVIKNIFFCCKFYFFLSNNLLLINILVKWIFF